MHLTTDEWEAIRDRFTAHLNGLNDDEPLPDDYFVDHQVMADEQFYGMYRFLLLQLLTNDEGGPVMLYLTCSTDDVTAIEHASWWFDASTTVWI